MKGAGNPAISSGKKIPDGPAQEIAGTLPQDFTLSNTKVSCYYTFASTLFVTVKGTDGAPLHAQADYRGNDKTVDNPVQGEALSTLGTGGDKKHPNLQVSERREGAGAQSLYLMLPSR